MEELSSQPGMEPTSPALQGGFLATGPSREVPGFLHLINNILNFQIHNIQDEILKDVFIRNLFFFFIAKHLKGFPGDSDGKESACNAGDLGSIPGLGGSPGGGNDNPLQYSCLENPHGWRSLAGYSSWAHKELDMTEQLSTQTLKMK